MSLPTFHFRPDRADPELTVYVDGTEPGFRSLSHWPGNTTPPSLRRDLSTGIALAFAALAPSERLEVLGPFEVLANNHYDTDGVLSAFAVLRPDEALPRAESLLAAAATGDFATWNGPEALALELTVMSVTDHPESPLAAQLPPGTSDRRRHALGYAWLLEHLPALSDDPFALARLWRAKHARILADVRAVEAGDGVAVARLEDVDLAVVTSRRPLTAIGLHHAAGELYRVLFVQPLPGGPRYRFLYRDESWFELASRRVPPRVPLDAAVVALREAEHRSGRTADGTWSATDLQRPVAELSFSTPSRAPDGFFEDLDLSAEPASSLDPAEVVELLRTHLARAARSGAPDAEATRGA